MALKNHAGGGHARLNQIFNNVENACAGGTALLADANVIGFAGLAVVVNVLISFNNVAVHTGSAAVVKELTFCQSGACGYLVLCGSISVVTGVIGNLGDVFKPEHTVRLSAHTLKRVEIRRITADQGALCPLLGEGGMTGHIGVSLEHVGHLARCVEVSIDQIVIKLTLYMGIASISGNMAGYKPEYQAWVSIYEYDTTTGEKGALIDRTYKIPKTDYTDNPDTVASGGTQQYLDITNPEAVDWYMNVIWGQLIDLGIDGCKIDFCETMPNEGDYKGMTVNDKVVDGYLEYDWYDETIFEGDTVHHAYASYFISLFYKSMVEQKAAKNIDEGFVVLSRGGGIGSQRNPYLWAGDQTRRFRNLSTQLAAVINSGLSGVPFMTYDMAGYAYKNLPDGYFGNYTVQEYDTNLFIPDFKAAEQYESEIFIRSMQYTIFGNTVQTHGDVRHLYHLTAEAQEITEMYDKLHSDLMWYSQKVSKYACDTGIPMIRHMVLQYQNDENVVDIDDQFMYGDALLVAPILTYNAKTENGKRVLDYGSDITRSVYLPAGTWLDLNTGKTIVSKGETIEVTVGLAQIPVFLNTNAEDAAELQKVFNSTTWRDIKGFTY